MITEFNFVPLVLLAIGVGYLIGWFFSKHKRYTVEIEFDTLDDIEAWRELNNGGKLKLYREEEIREIVHTMTEIEGIEIATLDDLLDAALKKLHKK